MPYAINKYDGTQVTVVVDGTINNALDIKLIGKNYAGYGEVQNENFLFLLENFAGSTTPGRPITGQLWYDTSVKKLRAFDGDRFRYVATSDQGSVAPSNAATGDFWFDTTNEQLYAWNNDRFLLIGPEGVPGYGETKLKSRTIKASLTGVRHAVLEGLVNGETVFVVSSDPEFTIDRVTHPLPDLTGFTKIHQGVTLTHTESDSSEGQTSTNHRFWGTTTNADKLGGYPAALHIRSDYAIFNSTAQFDNTGFTVGTTPQIQVLIDGGTPTLKTLTSNVISFKTKVGSTFVTPLKLVGTDILPGENGASNIGSANLKINTLYANIVDAISLRSQTLSVGGDFRTASSAVSSGTIVARTSVSETVNGVNTSAGSVKASHFIGIATSAIKLDSPSSINGIPFDGTHDIVIYDDTKVSKTGDVLTGYLTLHADPVTNYHPATKHYVDTATGALDETVQAATIALNQAIAAAQAALNAAIKDAEDQLHQAIDSAVGPKVGRGGDTMTGFLTLSADPTQNLHAATKHYVDFTVATRVPMGIITMWYGNLANIPPGWALCNGSSGTPDLRDRFVVGAGSSYSPSSTGGSAQSNLPAHTHTTASHSHTLSGSGQTSSAGNHSHSINDPGHSHSITLKRDQCQGTSGNAVYGDEMREGTGNETTNSAGTNISIQAGGDHAHSFTLSGSTTEGGAGTTSSAGSTDPRGNLPPYYALAYIMKL